MGKMTNLVTNLAIVIPARNEEKTVAQVVAGAMGFGKVIVVDDGSDDATFTAAQEAGATVLRHSVNLGKGAALKTGCEYALQCGADRLIVLDADAQHDPQLIPRFAELLDTYHVVFGYRTFSEEMPFVFRFGNHFINTVARVLYGIDLKDTQCGYRGFTAESYVKLRWKSHDYAVESEMVTHAGKHQLRYAQVPIRTVYHDRHKGTTIADGVKIVAKLLWWKVN